MGQLRSVWVALGAVILSCGGGAPVKPKGGMAGELAGVVVKGRVADGAVTAYRLDSQMNRGAVLANATTGADGAFTLALPAYNGPLLVVASTGTYTEEAIGLGVKLDGHELAAVVADYKQGTKVGRLLVTPISTWAAALAAFHVQRKGEALTAALDDAFGHLDSHFGNIDWRTTVPADPTVPGVSNLSPEATAGLVLASLSFEARLISQDSGITPGLTVNGATLSQALAQDLSDGTLDGAGPAGVLSQAKYALDGQTARRALSQAIVQFIQSDRNASSLGLSDVKGLVDALAADSDPYLFCPDQKPSNLCGGSNIDSDPPAITWSSPLDGVGVHGQVAIHVAAQDASKIASLAFTAPAQLTGVSPVLDATGHAGTLDAALDVSGMADGPLTLSVAAQDEFKNESKKSITIQVANHGPQISVQSPSDGATVKGSITVIASASAQNGTIAKLVLVEPPPGMGPDQLAAADSFAATWDTTLALEGDTQLHFRAEDSLGSPADTIVTVKVDNVPFGRISVAVSAGAPIPGAGIQVLAIDDATGMPLTSRSGGAVLGAAAATDAGGLLDVTLTQENYEGPIQVVASGANLTYIDPTDGTTPISLPGTFSLTSYVPHYKTGTVASVPLTLWTTLADAEALAYVRGKHPAAPSPHTLTQTLPVTDPLFSSHSSRPVSWDLRTTFPVLLTQPPTQTLRDVVFAELADLALNQLARDVSALAGVSPGQVITAPTLVAQLAGQDAAADGMLDGFGPSGIQLQTAGTPPWLLDANTTRVSLATALDEFILGPRNRSGLSRADLQNGGVYDNLSNDISILYPANQPPLDFDNKPPTVTFAATFLGSDGQQHPPVGASRLVAGVVSITADATDPSGVQTLSIAVNGSPVTPAPQGNTASHFAGTWTTTVDGPLTFTATATDKRFNTGSTTYVVTVDNTKPAVTITAPGGGYYAASVPVDVSASDADGVTGISSAGFSGLADVDTAPEHFAGTWAVPAAQADGPVSVSFTACDPVLNCGTASTTVLIDRTAPTVTMDATPAWTNTTPIAVGGGAIDGASGLASVSVSVNSLPGAAALSKGRWSLSIPLAAGANGVAVSATDKVGNASTPLTRTIGFDSTPPQLSVPSTGQPTYRDEAGLQITSPSGGYSCSTCALINTVDTSAGKIPFRKAQNRLSPGSPILDHAALQLAAGSFNIPFIAVNATDPGGSGIQAVTYDAVYACPTCGTAPVTYNGGALINAGGGLFELPLDSYYLGRQLVTAPAGASVTVTVKATDAAGNQSSLAFVYDLHILSPPVWVELDANYPNVVETENGWRYKYPANPGAPIGVNDLTYEKLWDGASRFPDGGPRWFHLRYSNPGAVPVGLNPGIAGQWTVNETWRDNVYAPPTSTDPDGAATTNAVWYRVYWPSALFCAYANYPCGNNTYGSQFPVHFQGSSTQWTTCLYTAPTSGVNTSGAIKSGSFALQPFVGGVAPAFMAGVTGYVIPAGGTLDLYVASPNDGRVLPYYPLRWQSYDSSTFTFKSWSKDFMADSGQATTPCNSGEIVHWFQRRRHSIEFDASGSSIGFTGGSSPSTYALDAVNHVVGDARANQGGAGSPNWSTNFTP